MSTINDSKSTLGELSFFHVTPIELFDALETPQNRIKCYLENNNFQRYLYQSLPYQLNSGNYCICKYYTEDEVNNIIQKGPPPHLSILHHNMRSMNINFTQLMGLLLNIDIDFDIITLTEIGHVNCENVALVQQHAHKFDSVKPVQTFGGMGIFIKKTLINRWT